MQFVRPKKLVFFNNKGGVGKTTIAYNTAVKFAHNGYKTVMVDLDPQCNLSRLALGNEFDNSLTSKTTIYEVLSGILYGGSDIDMSIPFKNIQENLFLLQGNLNLSLYEDRLSSAFTDASAGNPLGFFQTSAIDRFLTHKGLYEDVDLFIIDASPSLGLLNRAILLGSDYFITPLMPDAFSLQGIDNLGITFERWKNAWKITTQVIAKERGITTNNVLSGEGLFIWYIINSYNQYAQQPIKSHKERMEKIPGAIKEYLSEKHTKNGLVEQSWKQRLISLKDYGELASDSHREGKAIFDLEPWKDFKPVQGTIENWELAGTQFEELFRNIEAILMKY